MTKDKARDLGRLGVGNTSWLPNASPPEGTYHLTSLLDAQEIGKATARTNNTDYVVLGMILPASKAAALCHVLQDPQGGLPSPVFMLRKVGSEAQTSAALSATERIPFSGGTERPATSNSGQPINLRDLEIIPGRHEVRVKGKPVTLTYSEFRILQTLASHPGWVFDRDKIIHAVHGDHYNCTERAVDVQVTGLRKKLGSAGVYIQTVRGVGYRFME